MKDSYRFCVEAISCTTKAECKPLLCVPDYYSSLPSLKIPFARPYKLINVSLAATAIWYKSNQLTTLGSTNYGYLIGLVRARSYHKHQSHNKIYMSRSEGRLKNACGVCGCLSMQTSGIAYRSAPFTPADSPPLHCNTIIKKFAKRRL